MPVSFITNYAWAQSERTTWTVDNWGLDRARVPYRGASILKDAFENSLNRWSALPGYPKMQLEGWSSSLPTPSFPQVDLSYVGFRSGTIPPPKSTDGTSSQSAQGQGTYNDGVDDITVSGTVFYKANRTSWTWCETGIPPTYPRYATVRDMTDPIANIYAWSMTQSGGDNDGQPVNNIPLSAFTQILNSLTRGVFVSDYEREEIIPGALWACRADVEYRMLS